MPSAGSIGSWTLVREPIMSERDSLTLHVPDLPSDGVTVDCEVDAERLNLAATDSEVRDQLLVAAEVLPAGTDVCVSGVVTGTFVRECVRCLKRYDDACRIAFRVEYRASKPEATRRSRGADRPAKDKPGDTPAPSEGESYSYAGEELDLGPMLREQVILANPMQPLCRRDCRGLCPVCGEDRNLVQCGCVEARPPNPFAVLRQRWPQDGNST